MNYYNIFFIDQVLEGATIHSSVSAHTFEACITHDLKYFKTILYKILSYLNKRRDTKSFRYLFMVYNECLKQNKQIVSLPFVRICYGISVRLYSFLNENNHIVYQTKIIINPSLFMESFKDDFDPKLYDYTRIIPREDEFWNDFSPKLTNFLEKWDIINDSKVFSVSLSRIDFCADISLPESFPISTYIGYIHRVIKRFKYEDESFASDQYAHQSTSFNKSQAFTLYEKMYEQKAHHHNYYDDGSHLLRLEYKVYPRKIYEILSKISNTMMMEIDRTVTSKKSLEDVLATIHDMVILSPIILLYGIKLVFPRGSFLTKRDARKLMRDYVKNKETRYDIYEMLRELSSYTDYSDVVGASNRMKESFTPKRYYTLMSKIRSLGIAPLYLDDKDSQFGQLPCVYDIYVSAIMQTEEEYMYIQNFITE